MYHNQYISTTRTNYHHLPSSTEEHSATPLTKDTQEIGTSKAPCFSHQGPPTMDQIILLGNK